VRQRVRRPVALLYCMWAVRFVLWGCPPCALGLLALCFEGCSPYFIACGLLALCCGAARPVFWGCSPCALKAARLTYVHVGCPPCAWGRSPCALGLIAPCFGAARLTLCTCGLLALCFWAARPVLWDCSPCASGQLWSPRRGRLLRHGYQPVSASIPWVHRTILGLCFQRTGTNTRSARTRPRTPRRTS
jgi:hypothetical protein